MQFLAATTLRPGDVEASEVAAAIKDGAAATPSLRTLGTGAQQAAAGDRIYPGQIIGSTRYAPATQAIMAVVGNVPADADATNLAVTFTVPPSGVVIVMLDSFQWAQGDHMHMGLREGTALVPGSGKRTLHNTLLMPGAYSHRFPGLTPGEVKTWKWAIWCAASTTAGVRVYADAGNLPTDFGPAYMQVTAG
jgi:hypothetical protein